MKRGLYLIFATALALAGLLATAAPAGADPWVAGTTTGGASITPTQQEIGQLLGQANAYSCYQGVVCGSVENTGSRGGVGIIDDFDGVYRLHRFDAVVYPGRDSLGLITDPDGVYVGPGACIARWHIRSGWYDRMANLCGGTAGRAWHIGGVDVAVAIL